MDYTPRFFAVLPLRQNDNMISGPEHYGRREPHSLTYGCVNHGPGAVLRVTVRDFRN